MSNKKSKHYKCIHDGCPFYTDKRKAIVTHLLRTHNERKEDYECEYCDRLFDEEKTIEQHLHSSHPGKKFIYTCVSRIESVINKCAKEATLMNQPSSSQGGTPKSKSSQKCSPKQTPEIKVERKTTPSKSVKTTPSKSVKTKYSSTSRTAVNLDNSDSLPKISVPKNPYTVLVKQEQLDPENLDSFVKNKDDEDDDDFVDSSSFKAQVSPENRAPLRVKLKLKKHYMSSVGGSSKNPSPSAIPITRTKGFKYYDKLEVYHFIDEAGQRCCPFCPYKTTKNTIRVHLSGKHKIFFVKCSLCDYKAAFPHQINEHGVKYHHTTDFDVIHLTKEYREEVIANLPTSEELEQEVLGDRAVTTPTKQSIAHNQIIEEEDEYVNNVISDENMSCSDDDDDDDQSNSSTSDNRVFKIPKCQTSKTPYYSIQYENDQYMYQCSICPFKTPVRATIYTHKYRHENKAYKCFYCDYQSSPRSTVVFHIRSKHKGLPVEIVPTDKEKSPDRNPAQISNQKEKSTYAGNQDDEEEIESDQSDSTQEVKEEPMDFSDEMDNQSAEMYIEPVPNASSHRNSGEPTTQKTIIKVPQFKRNLTLVPRKIVPNKLIKKARSGFSGYKMSSNKLYRVNPNGAPKFLCNNCPYAADTHPKIKHHLYRHRPQQYKCPYCSHRKYPRSYVVRHVRDTHRDKPLRVINLLKSNKVINVDEDDDMEDEEGEQVEDECENGSENEDGSSDNSDAGLEHNSTDRSGNSVKQGAANKSDQQTSGKRKAPKSKTSCREYTINSGISPRYTCNLCSYGTENYKTIHTHMYRHEANQFQCGYCDFRKSPRSLVEAHIKVMHKGLPVNIKDLRNVISRNLPNQRHTNGALEKRKHVSSDQPAKKLRTVETSSGTPTNKLSIKWPAPRPVSSMAKSSPVSQSRKPAKKQKSPSPVQTTRQRTPSSSKRSPSPSVTNASSSSNSNKLNKASAANRSNFKTMYKCMFEPDVCKHISKDKSKMKQHLFHHVEYKPWSCDFCDMTASQSSHIKNHIRAEHIGSDVTSYKYKRHNYLEKHIEGFIEKGVFTVPISEYRVILEMKGSKKKHMTFEMDSKGYFLCPYCDYKTRGEGMYDHVKCKHRLPRYKCHYCHFKAFYRSEVRKHHRKDVSHADLEFKTDELDIKQMAEEYQEGKGDIVLTRRNSRDRMEADDDDEEDDEDDDDDDDEDLLDEDEDDQSLNDVNMFETNQFEYLSEEAYQTFPIPPDGFEDENAGQTYLYQTQNTSLLDSQEQKPNTELLQSTINGPSFSDKSSRTAPSKQFMCGYCEFSASLRIRVKMHCQKKHPDMQLIVVEPDLELETSPPRLLTDKEIKKEASFTSERITVNLPGEQLKASVSLKIPDFLSSSRQFEKELKAAGVSTLNLQSLSPQKIQEISSGQGKAFNPTGARKVLPMSLSKSANVIRIKSEPLEEEEEYSQQSTAESEVSCVSINGDDADDDAELQGSENLLHEKTVSEELVQKRDSVDISDSPIKIVSSMSLANKEIEKEVENDELKDEEQKAEEQDLNANEPICSKADEMTEEEEDRLLEEQPDNRPIDTDVATTNGDEELMEEQPDKKPIEAEVATTNGDEELLEEQPDKKSTDAEVAMTDEELLEEQPDKKPIEAEVSMTKGDEELLEERVSSLLAERVTDTVESNHQMEQTKDTLSQNDKFEPPQNGEADKLLEEPTDDRSDKTLVQRDSDVCIGETDGLVQEMEETPISTAVEEKTNSSQCEPHVVERNVDLSINDVSDECETDVAMDDNMIPEPSVDDSVKSSNSVSDIVVTSDCNKSTVSDDGSAVLSRNCDATEKAEGVNISETVQNNAEKTFPDSKDLEINSNLSKAHTCDNGDSILKEKSGVASPKVNDLQQNNDIEIEGDDLADDTVSSLSPAKLACS